MPTSAEPVRPLSVPAASPAHYSKNFIRLAVCELRFPTLFELEGERPPVALSKAIRKEYPTHELLKNVNLNPGGVVQANAHAFRSRKARWTVTVRAAALSLETTEYDTFPEFEKRLSFVIAAATSTIDSDFFTRVGLRYVNVLPVNDPREVGAWVNPALVAALGDGILGDVEEHWLRVRGPTSLGGYLFQHGLNTSPQVGGCEYILDFDFYREDVGVSEAVGVVRRLHELEFAMFDWSLGPKAKEYLGPSTLKGGA
jgi:uncharacterized protein (TIGR04255 family)